MSSPVCLQAASAAQQEVSELAGRALALAAQLEESQREAEAARADANAMRSRNALLEKSWLSALEVGVLALWRAGWLRVLKGGKSESSCGSRCCSRCRCLGAADVYSWALPWETDGWAPPEEATLHAAWWCAAQLQRPASPAHRCTSL